jgi:hydrogenase maturation protease
VRARVGECVNVALGRLHAWGHAARRRHAGAAINAPALGMARYEAERPSPELACRIGDARFLAEA